MLENRGLLAPFKRDRKSDFASGNDEALIRSSVRQILGTIGSSDFTQGELAWRTDFGSLLYFLRHQKNNVVLQELAKVYVQDALRKWEPRIVVTNLTVKRLEDDEKNKLVIRLKYNVVQKNAPGSQVLIEGLEQTITT